MSGTAFVSLRRARLLAAVWGCVLLVLTSWPSPPEVPGISSIPDVDKIVHALLYGVEGFLLYFAIRWPEPARNGLLRALVVGGSLAVWGTLDEVHQAWIPGRSMEAADALTDGLAGLAGGVIAGMAARRSRGQLGRVEKS